MSTIKTHPIYESLRNLQDAVESEVRGQTDHATTGEFSSSEQQLKAVVMAGNFAKALLMLREVGELIPRTYEAYFADVNREGSK